jgi:tryptophan synthase alpha chain
MFARLRERGEAAFGAFAMLGDPDLESSLAILDLLARSGADMLEVGFPFSDPVADGPVIQAASVRALRRGVTQADCFALLAELRTRHPDIPVGILTYANLVLARGRDAFYGAAAEAGVDSVLIADLPSREAGPFVAAARRRGVAPVLVAAPNTPRPALRRIADLGQGYTYCVTRRGVTGAGEPVGLDDGGVPSLLRRFGAPPPIFGFGISKPDHVRAALAAGAAGAICGSAIVRIVAAGAADRPLTLRRFVAAMKAATLSGMEAPVPVGGSLSHRPA